MVRARSGAGTVLQLVLMKVPVLALLTGLFPGNVSNAALFDGP